MLTCPQCRSERVYRSKRRGIFERRVLPLAFLMPFRCERCDYRFFLSLLTQRPAAFRMTRKANSSAAISPGS